MNGETAVALIFSLLIAGGILVVFAGIRHRTKVLEMAHRERLAMIERGSELPASPYQEPSTRRAARSSRLLSAGIVIVGFGLGIATLIGFASREPEIAVGVGGAVAILGVALIVTALVVNRDSAEEAWTPGTKSGADRKSYPSDPSV